MVYHNMTIGEDHTGANILDVKETIGPIGDTVLGAMAMVVSHSCQRSARDDLNADQQPPGQQVVVQHREADHHVEREEADRHDVEYGVNLPDLALHFWRPDLLPQRLHERLVPIVYRNVSERIEAWRQNKGWHVHPRLEDVSRLLPLELHLILGQNASQSVWILVVRVDGRRDVPLERRDEEDVSAGMDILPLFEVVNLAVHVVVVGVRTLVFALALALALVLLPDAALAGLLRMVGHGTAGETAPPAAGPTWEAWCPKRRRPAARTKKA
mmetsp:Transcript_99888/g.282738  ORF Transcript_99888/g.282738 Transcript_99888/m.282738 type:complete len:270 (+) Transcript_99888:784-1593(+)